jgi:hypothetical protein
MKRRFVHRLWSPRRQNSQLVTVDGGFERHAVAGVPPRNAGAGFHHRAGRLVADHLGVHALDVAHPAFGVIVQIRSANAHRIDAHQ